MASKMTFQVMPTGLRAKLMWAAVLMSCIPLTVLIVFVGWFVFPYTREAFPWLERFFLDPRMDPAGGTWWLWGVLALTALVSLLGGAYLMVKVVQPVLEVSREAKRLADHPELDEAVPEQEDELGDVTRALNQLTGRIRESMQELKQFGERTNEINTEIHRRMTMLASLLQIGELIGKATNLEVVLDLVVERLGTVEDEAFSFLCLQPTEGLNVGLRRGHQIDVQALAQCAFEFSSVIVDAGHRPTEHARPLWAKLGQPNLVFHPVQLRGQRVGMLAFGNRQPGYAFGPELVEFVSVFAKQVSIALENEFLLRKNKALAVRDELTGLYNERYIRQRLDEEIKRAIAYQRPCAIAVFTVDGLEAFRARRGQGETEQVLKKVGRVIEESVTDLDRVGYFAANEFVVILPERNKREAIEIAEGIRQRVEFAFASADQPLDRLTVSGGIAENPLDGVTADDLLSKSNALVAANGARSRNTVAA